MADGSDPSDPCICACVYAMRRLMEAIKMSQRLCSDTGCFDYPTLQRPPVINEQTQLLLLVCVWIIIAIVMFLYRPRSLRSNYRSHKRLTPQGHPPPPDDDPSHGGPPQPSH